MPDSFNPQTQHPKWPSLSGSIYCVGRNYAEHAKELGNQVPQEPVIFLKAPSSLRSLAEGPLAFADETYHHELELCLLIGQEAKSAADINADTIVALTLGLDLTRRAVQDQLKKQSLPWTIAKSFAGAGILAPFVSASGIELKDIDMQLKVNGELKQTGNTNMMIFSCHAILAYLTKFQTLVPGDLIFTGTPSGVGPVKKGDRLLLQSQTLGITAEGRL